MDRLCPRTGVFANNLEAGERSLVGSPEGEGLPVAKAPTPCSSPCCLDPAQARGIISHQSCTCRRSTTAPDPRVAAPSCPSFQALRLAHSRITPCESQEFVACPSGVQRGWQGDGSPRCQVTEGCPRGRPNDGVVVVVWVTIWPQIWLALAAPAHKGSLFIIISVKLQS